MKTTAQNKVNRFTGLDALKDIVKNRHLKFSDPKFWDDKNDSELLEIYRKKKNTSKVLALCFLEGNETIHHWMAFAGGKDGCCIEFDKAKLKQLFSRHKSDGVVGFKRMDYSYTIENAKKGTINANVDDLPFIKRQPYKCESEFRAVWCGNVESYCIPVDLEIINRITMSPLMPRFIFETFKDFLKTNGAKCKVNASTIYWNTDWIRAFRTKFLP
jgi:hypothetical protein